MSGRSSPPSSPTRLEEQRAAQHKSSVFQSTATVVADEECLTTEVSEHLADSSAATAQSHSVPSMQSVEALVALTASPAYSEDFEPSSGSLASEASFSRTQDTLSQFSSRGRSDPPPGQSLSRTKWGQGVSRVVKETAVQTLDPAFAYQWSTGELGTCGNLGHGVLQCLGTGGRAQALQSGLVINQLGGGSWHRFFFPG